MITCFISKLAVKHVKYYYKDKLSHKTDLQGIQSLLSYYKYIIPIIVICTCKKYSVSLTYYHSSSLQLHPYLYGMYTNVIIFC